MTSVLSNVRLIVKPSITESPSEGLPVDSHGDNRSDPELQRAVTWQRLGPLDDPQQLFLAQPVETVEQEVGNIRVGVVITYIHNLWFNVFQDTDDLLGELHLTDAWYARHGGQGLIVAGHGQVGLKHQGRGQTQGFQGPKTLQFSSCNIKTKA